MHSPPADASLVPRHLARVYAEGKASAIDVPVEPSAPRSLALLLGRKYSEFRRYLTKDALGVSLEALRL
jgi:hypothetical protein